MYIKLLIFALIGTTFVSASPVVVDDVELIDRDLSEYLNKWWNTIWNHYYKIQDIAKKITDEIKSQFVDAYNINKEAIISIQKQAQEAVNKYYEEKSKWEAKLKEAVAQGKDVLKTVQAEAAEALNVAFENLKIKYEEIKNEIKQKIGISNQPDNVDVKEVEIKENIVTPVSEQKQEQKQQQ